jgi:nitroreductase
MPVMAPPAPTPTATTAGRERLLRLVEYAILAPSSHNSQPWTFAVSEDEIRIFVDRDRWLPMADPDQRELYVSIGCALENLLIAAERFGRTTRVWYDGGFDS